MPLWLQIVSLIVGILGTILGICGITSYIGERAKHKASLKNKAEDSEAAKKVKEMKQLEEIRHEAYVTELRGIIKSELEPVIESIDVIQKEIVDNNKATVAGLRATMKELRDHYIDQGYADTGDKATWNELYDDYKEMGGNHFKEWVNIWKEDVNKLDESPKSKSKRKVSKNKKKTILLENK